MFRNTHKSVSVDPLKLMAAMYAAKSFVKDAEMRLSDTSIGLRVETLSHNLELSLGSLESRLKELHPPVKMKRG